RITAIAIKLVVVAGGIVIVAGPGQLASRIIGILVALAASFDGIFLNHKRLLVAEEAVSIFKLLLETVHADIGDQLLFVKKCQDAKSEDYVKPVTEFMISTREELSDMRTKIQLALQQVDREA